MHIIGAQCAGVPAEHGGIACCAADLQVVCVRLAALQVPIPHLRHPDRLHEVHKRALAKCQPLTSNAEREFNGWHLVTGGCSICTCSMQIMAEGTLHTMQRLSDKAPARRPGASSGSSPQSGTAPRAPSRGRTGRTPAACPRTSPPETPSAVRAGPEHLAAQPRAPVRGRPKPQHICLWPKSRGQSSAVCGTAGNCYADAMLVKDAEQRACSSDRKGCGSSVRSARPYRR